MLYLIVGIIVLVLIALGLPLVISVYKVQKSDLEATQKIISNLNKKS